MLLTGLATGACVPFQFLCFRFRLGAGCVADLRPGCVGVLLRQLTMLLLRFGSSIAHRLDEVVGDFLCLAGRVVNLSRLLLEHLEPVLDVGCAAPAVMSDAYSLARHHGADLRPQFFARVGFAPEARRNTVLQRFPIQAAFVSAGVTQFVQRRLVVAVGRGKLPLFRQHHLIVGEIVEGPISGNVADAQSAAAL